MKSSAIISDCGIYRYRLDRQWGDDGLTFAFFGVNPSTADGDVEDQTTLKWRGFAERNGGKGYIAGNPFAFRTTDVKALMTTKDPVGPDNAQHIGEIIACADILVPCWGNTSKVPPHLRFHFTALMKRLVSSGKPVKVFGFTKNRSPLHPLMLGYGTQLVEIGSD